MPLRKADLTTTKRFEDGADWLVLRVGGLTKGEADHVSDLTGALKIDPQAFAGSPDVAASIEIEKRTAQANRLLFEILCSEWSLGEVTGVAYSELDNASGQWVDKCIAEVLEEHRKRAEKTRHRQGSGPRGPDPRLRGRPQD